MYTRYALCRFTIGIPFNSVARRSIAVVMMMLITDNEAAAFAHALFTFGILTTVTTQHAKWNC